MHGISFVIVTYNSMKTIDECVRSVLAQEAEPLEVLVVDNASVDGTPEFVRLEFPGTKVIRNQRNVGYGIANNTGARVAQGEILAVLNPDVALDAGWSAEIARVIRGNGKCAAAEGKLLLADRPMFVNCAGSTINLLGFGCMTHYGESASVAPDEKLVGYASGAAFAMRRDVFHRVGGFDESYFLYQEDVDLGLRTYRAGWEVRYAPKAIAYHHYNSDLNARKVRCLERNRWRTLAKNMPLQYFLLCGPLLVVSELGLTLKLASLGLLGAKMRATLEFLREPPDIGPGRKGTHEGAEARRRLIYLLTDDFPEILPLSERSAHLGRALVKGYHRAFMSRSP